MLTPIRSQILAALLALLIAGSCQAQVMLGLPAAPTPTTYPGASVTPIPALPTAVGMPAPLAVLPAPLPEPRPAGPVCQKPWHFDPLELYTSVYPAGAHGESCVGGPPACAPYEDRNGPLLIGDPLLDSPPATPGWVVGVELAGVVPHVENKLFSPVTLMSLGKGPAPAAGSTTTVQLPAADLGARVMPRIEAAYRFGQGSGELLLSYNFVVGDGTQYYFAPVFAPTGANLRSRLDMEVLDIDYGNYEPSLGPNWDMFWRVGLRGMIFYTDSQATNGISFQQETDRYWGIGPHAVLDLRRWIGDSGFAMFGRAEVAMPWGRVAQRYIEIDPTVAGETRFFENQQAVTLTVQLGLAWSPQRCSRIRFTAGYIVERLIDVGAIFTGVAPRETLTIEGGFFRGEWNY